MKILLGYLAARLVIFACCVALAWILPIDNVYRLAIALFLSSLITWSVMSWQRDELVQWLVSIRKNGEDD